MIKHLVKRIVRLVCLILLLQPDITVGQWRRVDLGTQSTEELLIGGVITLSGGIIALVIPLPKPELHIKRSDLVNKDNSIASGHDQAIAKLRAFSKACLIREKSPNRNIFGMIRSVQAQRFVVETRLDSAEVPYERLKEVFDLHGAARRYKNIRIKSGVFVSSLAVSSFYSAVIADHPYGGASRALSWALFSGMGALAAYSLIHESDAEKEYQIWHEDYIALSSPSKLVKGKKSPSGILSNSTIGLKFGLNFANISNIEDTNFKTGFISGVYLLHDLHQIYHSLSIQPEILFSTKGYRQEAQSLSRTISGSFTAIYLEIPVLAKLSIPIKSSFTPSLLVGPALAVKLNSTFEVEGQTLDVEGVETIDFGMILGGGGRLRQSPFTFEIRYNLGLKSVSETGDVKNRAFSILGGYSF